MAPAGRSGTPAKVRQGDVWILHAEWRSEALTSSPINSCQQDQGITPCTQGYARRTTTSFRITHQSMSCAKVETIFKEGGTTNAETLRCRTDLIIIDNLKSERRGLTLGCLNFSQNRGEDWRQTLILNRE